MIGILWQIIKTVLKERKASLNFVSDAFMKEDKRREQDNKAKWLAAENGAGNTGDLITEVSK